MSITTIDSLAGGMETLSRLIASCGEVDREVVDLLPKPWPPHERALTHKCRSWFSTAWAFKSDRSAALFTYTYSLPRSYCNETEADWLCWNASDFPSTCVIPHRETLSSSMVAVSLSLWAWRWWVASQTNDQLDFLDRLFPLPCEFLSHFCLFSLLV